MGGNDYRYPRSHRHKLKILRKGFNLKEIKGKGGLGLVSMEERARLVRGKLVVQSAPGEGTRIEIRVPLPLSGRN